jgi:ubiquinone/menaquinone biosynthesis C-methylase UbiE
VKRELRLERVVLGMYGLALLRGWPFGDAAEASALIDRIRELCADRRADGRAEPLTEVVEIDEPGIDAAYAEWSETYDSVPNGLIAIEEPVIEALLSSLPQGSAVDVACGTGRLASVLAGIGHQVVGIDRSSPMIARAVAKVDGAAFVVGDIGALPVDEDSFDLAVCALSLTHVDDIARPVTELARVVRRGGHVVLSDVHPVAVATGAHGFFKAEDGRRFVARNAVHWPSEYVRAFNAAGLRVERLEEPVVGPGFADEISNDAVRTAAREALLGLPLALIWLLRKP